MTEYQNLYIHVPFCAHKCDYCAFFSMTGTTPAEWNAWLDRIVADLQANSDRLQHLNTVYFGGGTPTLPNVRFLERMYERIFNLIGLNSDAEVSTEANPETLTLEKAQLLSRYVNRVSMGVQSFNTDLRRTMGRHPVEPDCVFAAVSALRQGGMRNIGLDLIYGVYGEKMDEWLNDLNEVVALQPKHLSTYSLIPEEGTPYVQHYGLTPSDDEVVAEMGFEAERFLTARGYAKYEISNYAMPGFEARHNVNVWLGQTYLGIGPSAVSFDGTDRWTENDRFTGWLNGESPEYDRIPRKQRLAEMLFMGLRTTGGWTRDVYERATGGVSWSFATAQLNQLQDCGLLVFDDNICRATPKGLNFWDNIAEILLTNNDSEQ